MSMRLDSASTAVPVHQAMAVLAKNGEVVVNIRATETAGDEVMDDEGWAMRYAAGAATEGFAGEELLLALAVEHDLCAQAICERFGRRTQSIVSLGVAIVCDQREVRIEPLTLFLSGSCWRPGNPTN